MTSKIFALTTHKKCISVYTCIHKNRIFKIIHFECRLSDWCIEVDKHHNEQVQDSGHDSHKTKHVVRVHATAARPHTANSITALGKITQTGSLHVIFCNMQQCPTNLYH